MCLGLVGIFVFVFRLAIGRLSLSERKVLFQLFTSINGNSNPLFGFIIVVFDVVVRVAVGCLLVSLL